MEQKLEEALRKSLEAYIEKHYLEVWLPECVCMLECDESIGSYVEPRREKREKAAASKTLSLEELLRQEDAGFTETLLKWIDKSGKKDAEIYKKANISKQHFSKIRSNPRYRPTKATALALAMALELSVEDTEDLIARAGYALSYSSKFDLIVRYFIQNGKYNITELNIALYEFDQPLLGA